MRVNAERPVHSATFNSMDCFYHGSVSGLGIEIAFMTLLPRSMKQARDPTGPCTMQKERSPKTVC